MWPDRAKGLFKSFEKHCLSESHGATRTDNDDNDDDDDDDENDGGGTGDGDGEVMMMTGSQRMRKHSACEAMPRHFSSPIRSQHAPLAVDLGPFLESPGNFLGP